MAACEQGKAVRYVTCAALVNELVEAADERRLPGLSPVMGDSTCSVSTSSAMSSWTPGDLSSPGHLTGGVPNIEPSGEITQHCPCLRLGL